MSRKERERRARIARDPFGIHEALHTAHVMMDAYCLYVAEHAAVEERPEIAALAEKAIDAMMDVYQALGALPEHNA
jgi:hypothetical protein